MLWNLYGVWFTPWTFHLYKSTRNHHYLVGSHISGPPPTDHRPKEISVQHIKLDRNKADNSNKNELQTYTHTHIYIFTNTQTQIRQIAMCGSKVKKAHHHQHRIDHIHRGEKLFVLNFKFSIGWVVYDGQLNIGFLSNRTANTNVCMCLIIFRHDIKLVSVWALKSFACLNVTDEVYYCWFKYFSNMW